MGKLRGGALTRTTLVEHVASNRMCNRFTTKDKILLADKFVFEILDVHTVMRCSLLDTMGCQLMLTNSRYSGERCQYR